MRQCKVDGCRERHWGKGFCRQHYNELYLKPRSIERRREKHKVEPLEGEEWKNVVGYEGRYMVSNFGRVKRLEYQGRHNHGVGVFVEKLVKFRVNDDGYLVATLHDPKYGGRHTSFLHRIITEAFLPKPDWAEQVNHKDGNKLNNSLSNLEWVTQKENIQHSFWVLKQRVKPIKCVETGEKWDSAADAGRCLGISRKAITNQLKGWQNSCKGMHFEYLEN